MKALIVAFVAVLVVGAADGGGRADAGWTAVQDEGRAALAAGAAVEVTIDTRKVTDEERRASPMLSDPWRANLTKGRVAWISIRVAGQALFVPRSVFCDLYGVTRARIDSTKKGEWTLVIEGGDGSEGYEVKVEFDRSRVKRRVVESLMAPGEPNEETVYHQVVL